MNEKLLGAAQNGNNNLIKEMLDSGANIDATYIDGKTPLMIAVAYSNTTSSLETVKLLLERGANINATDNEGFTPLMIACYNTSRSSSLETVELLLDRGANIEARSIDGTTALMISCFNTSKSSSLETVKLLLDRGANIEAMDENEMTSLMYAVEYSNDSSSIETVRLLLDRGANVNAFRKGGYTPLMFASKLSNKSSSLETVKLLLDRGADINAISENGKTSLMFAAENTGIINPLETVKLLLERGADPFVKDIYGSDAFTLCNTSECENLVSQYISKRLYTRDMETAKRYGKSVLSKDVWELILLNKRQAQLCSKLSSNKNREVLKYFALELGIPVPEGITKGKLCALISRYLAYNKYFSEAGKKYTEEKMNKQIKYIRDLASQYNLDRNRPIGEILQDLSHMF